MTELETLHNRCPHLGLKDNPKKWVAYPEERNHCHCPTAPQPIAISHQSDMCLSGGHADCPVFQRVGVWNGPLPPDILPEPSGGREMPFLRVIRPRAEAISTGQAIIGQRPLLAGATTAELAHRLHLQARRPKQGEAEGPIEKKEPNGQANAIQETRPEPRLRTVKKSPPETRGRKASPVAIFLGVFAPLVAGVALITFALFGGFDVLRNPTPSVIDEQPPAAIPTMAPVTIAVEEPEGPTSILAPETQALDAAAELESVVETTLRFDSNLRTGPGAEFEDTNFLTSGARIAILARDERGEWLLIRTEDGQEGWIAETQVAGDIDFALIPVFVDTGAPTDGG